MSGFIVREVYGGSENPLTLSSAVDKIEAFDKTYTVEDSYVYTARVRFTTGQAAGIAFGIKNGKSFVLNVDRLGNRTKLMYFTEQDSGYSVKVLKEDYYIGNTNCSDAELKRVGGFISVKTEFYIKVAVTGGDTPSVKCYVDDILRFEYDNDILLNSFEDVSYDGGAIGLNVYNAEVVFGEIYYGETDFTHYAEIYRNQYHYSPFSGWNNDPNGLVFDGEYYHLYYQAQPFQKTWGDMYWGHARSKDLLVWENLPIALLPTDGNYMWSGSAIIDRDNRSGLFGSKEGSDYDGSQNIIIYYTVDGGANQTQWMAYSLDGGFTFKKHKMIIDGANVTDGRTFRDPKVFEIGDGIWGIIIGGGRLRFYHSFNLTDWKLSSETPVFGECPDVYKLYSGSEEKWVINVGGIAYIVGNLTFEDNKIRFVDQFGVDITDPATSAGQIKVFDLDNANGSYATQTFYINNTASAYNGEVIGLSWFAGQPGYQAPMDSHIWLSGEQAVGPDTGAQAQNRSIWNGGFTIPVKYSLKQTDGVYVLRQTPVSLQNFSEVIFERNDITVGGQASNILSDVRGNSLKITASIRTSAEKFGFRVFVGDGEYTEAGFSAEDGYYLDRRNTSDGGTAISHYSEYYASGINDYVSADGSYDFVILLDWGSMEMFCEDGTQVFYANTYAGYNSDGLQFFVDGDDTANADIKIEKISGVFRENSDEAKLTLSSEAVELDTVITDSAEVYAYTTGEGSIEWAADTDGVVQIAETDNGAVFNALAAGQTNVTVTLKDSEGNITDRKTVAVTVKAGNESASNLDFSASGIKSGSWHSGSDGITGVSSGDGFILAEGVKDDFVLTAKVNVVGAEAAAVIFRASDDMSFYYAANYDRRQRVVKLWSTEREFVNRAVGIFDEVTLHIKGVGNEFKFYFNGSLVCEFTDASAPVSGKLGLNVFNGTAVFGSVTYGEAHGSDYEYVGSDLTVYLSADNYVSAIYNFTLKNTLLDREFYSREGNLLVISDNYLKTLEGGVYVFIIAGESVSEEIRVTVPEKPFSVSDMTIAPDSEAYVDVGGREISAVSVNGTALTGDLYEVSEGVLTLLPQAFADGANIVVLELAGGENVTFTVTVRESGSGETGIGNITIDEISAVSVNIGNSELSSVSINGTEITTEGYSVTDGILTINENAINNGTNIVILGFADGTSSLFMIFAPEAESQGPTDNPDSPANKPGNTGAGWGDILFYVVGSIEAVLIVFVLVKVIIRRRKSAKR